MLVGASGADPNGDRSGSSYVVFGRASGFDASMSLSDLDGSNGFRLDGLAERDFLGGSVSSAGDVNGDGFDDVIIGSNDSADAYSSTATIGYLVFGTAAGFSPAFNLSGLDGSNGLRLDVDFYNARSTSVSSAGDINGDGFDDVVIHYLSSIYTFRNYSESFVVFGKASGFDAALDLSSLDGSNGFRLGGVDYGPYSYGAGGLDVSDAGDVNGDGVDDLIVGSPSGGGSSGYSSYYAGVSYVVFGRTSGFGSALNLASLDGSDGFRLYGENRFDRSGGSVSAAGDVNGDGFDDVIVGVRNASPYEISRSGASYVVFGRASGFAAALELSSLDSSSGVRLIGAAAGDYSGGSVSSAGDVNGDGFDDLLVGAPGADPNGNESGASYVLFGSSNFTDPRVIPGTPGDDTLTGTTAAERFGAGDGNDTMIGGGGADVFNGDAGDDIIRVPDLDFHLVSGGTGSDTLELTGSGIDLNLANFRGDSRGDFDNTIRGIEIIDLTGSGDNTLTVTEQDLLDLSDTSDTLVVKGNAGDHVAGLSQGWADGGIQGNLHAFTKHGATLLIDTTVSTDPLTPSVINLSNLNGNNGFRLDGVAADDRLGGSVSSAGDVNGDGFDDLIISATGADPNGDYSGSSYVVFGKSSGFAAAMDLSSLDGNNGFRLDGKGVGFSVSGAGDVNGDGFDDVIVNNHVVFGKASGFDATLDLSSLDGNTGFYLGGAGESVSNAGDVNGDGFDDLIIGAPSADPNGVFSGSSYVVFGKASGFDAALDLSDLDGNNGFRLDGSTKRDYAGRSVSSAGDVNGDGFDDLLVGVPGARPNDEFRAGSSYVVFGRASGFAAALELSGLDGNNGFRLDGSTERDYAGRSVSSVGDVNGDGFSDVIVAATMTNGISDYAGANYVVFGRASGFAAAIDLSSLDGRNGFRLDGEAQDNLPNNSVSSAGDVNGDGFDDVIISSSRYSGYSGPSYVVFGKASGFSATLDLSSLDGSNGVRLDGEASINSVSGAGDVNGDGFDDLIVGAPLADPNGERSGSSYVIFGSRNFRDIVTFVGTSGDDTLTGTTAAERFEAGDGNDIMIGGGGADVFQGGTGDDVIRVPDAGFLSVDGGADNNTLELTGSGADLNLSSFRDTIRGIDTIDLTGSGDNALTVTDRDLLNLSDTSDTLVVKGNAGDHVAGLSQGWSDGGMQGNFHVFIKHAAVLLVDTVVSTEPLTRSVINLSNLNANNGFRLDGEAAGDNLGDSVSNAGDVNGDGFDDVIVGASRADPNGDYSGSSYVVFGKAAGFDAAMDLSSLDGSNGFRLDGVAPYDFSDGSVSNAGDINGDGFDDVLVGAPDADPNGNNSGSSYVVFGRASGFDTAMDLSSLDGSNGFRLDGVVERGFSFYVSNAVSNAGDVNGDGFDDVIVSATYAGPNGERLAGSSYVVFGRASGFDAAMDLSSLDGSNGFRLDGVSSGDFSGASVSNAGDINGDGFDDVIIGAPQAGSNVDRSGSSYVVFGKADGFDATLNLSSLNGSNGFRLDGKSKLDYSGSSVSGAGDVNGDGFADVIIGAYRSDPSGSYDAGSSYVVFGKASGFDAAMNLSSLNGSNGFRADGELEGDRSGKSVSSAGDVNGDGFDDVIIASSNNYSGNSGSSYVVFGRASDFSATLDLSSLDGSNGVRLDGEVSINSVSGAGDVNGDGFDDLIVGVPYASPNGALSGSSYVVFGRSDFGSGGEVKVIQGTPGNDKLTGTPAAEIFQAGDGNDRMIGRGREDVFHGDAGDDYIQVTDLGFVLVDGGSGNDTLHTDGKDLDLDLGFFGDKIHGIETICLYGRGDNTLTLTAEGLLNLSDTDNMLRVNGNAGDRIAVVDDGWVDEGNRGEGYFHVYTNDDAVLLVGMNVTVDFV